MNAQGIGNGLEKNAAGESSNVAKAKDEAGSAMANARDAASKLAESARSTVSDYASSGAQALKETADERSAQIARAVRRAAEGAENISNSVRDTSVNDLMASIGDFAKQRPAAFFGCGMLAGFLLSRLLSGSDR
jgi:hypothetical protein